MQTPNQTRIQEDRNFLMTEEPAQTFARWLREFRQSRNLGLNQFAALTNLSNATISKVESNEHVPSPYTIQKIANRWNQDEDWLLALAGHRTPALKSENRLDDPELLVLLSATNLNKLSVRDRKILKTLVRTMLEVKE
jgi:transcriptional regulator with XRE-family HTH domain